MAKVSVDLIQPARKSGGDKYEGILAGAKFTVYIPQVISRATTGYPADALEIEITEK